MDDLVTCELAGGALLTVGVACSRDPANPRTLLTIADGEGRVCLTAPLSGEAARRIGQALVAAGEWQKPLDGS